MPRLLSPSYNDPELADASFFTNVLDPVPFGCYALEKLLNCSAAVMWISYGQDWGRWDLGLMLWIIPLEMASSGHSYNI